MYDAWRKQQQQKTSAAAGGCTTKRSLSAKHTHEYKTRARWHSSDITLLASARRATGSGNLRQIAVSTAAAVASPTAVSTATNQPADPLPRGCWEWRRHALGRCSQCSCAGVQTSADAPVPRPHFHSRWTTIEGTGAAIQTGFQKNGSGERSRTA